MKGCLKFGCGTFLFIVSLGIIIGLANSGSDSKTNNTYLETKTERKVEEQALSPEEQHRQDSIRLADEARREEEKSYWSYYDDVDEMSNKTTYFAQINSENRAYFDFPYEGGSSLMFTIRRKKGLSRDIYINISKGQFNSTYQSGYVKIKFDDKPAKSYSISESTTYDSDIRFINGTSQILNELKKAKVMKIQADFYSEGSHTFTFKVQNFKADNFK